MSDKAGIYLPPGVRNRQGIPKSTTDRVCRRFADNGWRRPSGGSDLYLNPWGTSEHPHFHMRVDGYRITVQDDVRDAILFLSWSRGDQAEGGSAWKLYDRNGHIFERSSEKGYNRGHRHPSVRGWEGPVVRRDRGNHGLPARSRLIIATTVRR